MKTKMYVALAAMAVLAVPPTAATAANPHAVDPTTVTPGLSPDFNPWHCFTAGLGITCQGAAEETYDLDIDLTCGGAVVHVAGRERAGMTRWHDADGLALRAEVRRSFADRLTIAGTDEPAVHLSARRSPPLRLLGTRRPHAARAARNGSRVRTARRRRRDTVP